MELSRLVVVIHAERRRRGSEKWLESIPAAAERMGMAHATWIDILKERTQPSP